jgi:hypothetical protein
MGFSFDLFSRGHGPLRLAPQISGQTGCVISAYGRNGTVLFWQEKTETAEEGEGLPQSLQQTLTLIARFCSILLKILTTYHKCDVVSCYEGLHARTPRVAGAAADA